MNQRIVKLLLMLLCFAAMSSCAKDTIKLAESSRTFTYDTEYQIDATSKSPISYSSMDDFYATVSSSGKVRANHVGTTKIILSNDDDSKEFSVSVIPLYYTYPEPKIAFGDTKSQVKAALGNPNVEQDDALLYANYTYNCQLAVRFENNKVVSYIVLVPTSLTSQVTDFLIERYASLGMSGGAAYFCNHDKTIAIGEQVYSASYIMVLYMPFPQNKSLSGIWEMLYTTGQNTILKNL